MHPDHAERLADELLVLAAQGGERAAFEALARRWQARLWRHARRVTGRDDRASDVAQDAWLVIATDLGRLVLPSRFGSWALSIVTRRALDRLRRDGAEPQQQVVEPHAAGGAADDADEAHERMRRALDRLPAEQRALLALHHVEGLALGELAVALDVPEGTLKSRLHTARQALRDSLERTQP